MRNDNVIPFPKLTRIPKFKDPNAAPKAKRVKRPPRVPLDAAEGWSRVRKFFASRGWSPLDFQEETWRAYNRGESGLLTLPTGAGKTYAAYLAPMVAAAASREEGYRIIYVTPLRALSRDIEKALRLPVEELGLGLHVESRTGDTSSSERARQRTEKPNVLVTTPESLSLLLSYDDARENFRHLDTLIIDEWHELLSTKRGSLLELSTARLRAWCPRLRTWALSATIANLDEAAKAALGTDSRPTIVTGTLERPIEIETLLPDEVDAFPWAGHLGLRMLPKLLDDIDTRVSNLVFTNTRSQAERWYRSILDARPEWESIVALHHGSLSPEERSRAENGLKDGVLKVVVATSSLDLGVDLAPVERVYQIGSPKGVARLIQRAGRAAHTPGRTSRIGFVPTHALELIEISAAREAIRRKEIECRAPIEKPLDVLAQHLVTCALGGGFVEAEMRAEIQTAQGFRNVTDEEWKWTLALVREGGTSLSAYADYHRVAEVDGRCVVPEKRIARQHRLNIGTITSDTSMLVRFAHGGKLGHIEESYITRLRRGDKFLFAGRLLELVMVRDFTAYVKKTTGKASQTPRWSGSRMPLSPSLAVAMRRRLDEAKRGEFNDPEMDAAEPVLSAQAFLSVLPEKDELLAEITRTREGHHLFIYPFEGRLVHEALAALLAWRMAKRKRATFSLSVNDYGIEWLSPEEFPYEAALDDDIFSTDDLIEDARASVNLAELARRQFREIARVAGLVHQNYPGREKTGRQLQTSSSLLYDVFMRYDPDNLLLRQAQREVLENQFEAKRLREALERISNARRVVKYVKHPTPLAFPLVVDRFGARLSTETLLERIERMKRQWTSTSKVSPSRSSRRGPSTGPREKR